MDPDENRFTGRLHRTMPNGSAFVRPRTVTPTQPYLMPRDDVRISRTPVDNRLGRQTLPTPHHPWEVTAGVTQRGLYHNTMASHPPPYHYCPAPLQGSSNQEISRCEPFRCPQPVQMTHGIPYNVPIPAATLPDFNNASSYAVPVQARSGYPDSAAMAYWNNHFQAWNIRGDCNIQDWRETNMRSTMNGHVAGPSGGHGNDYAYIDNPGGPSPSPAELSLLRQPIPHTPSFYEVNDLPPQRSITNQQNNQVFVTNGKHFAQVLQAEEGVDPDQARKLTREAMARHEVSHLNAEFPETYIALARASASIISALPENKRECPFCFDDLSENNWMAMMSCCQTVVHAICLSIWLNSPLYCKLPNCMKCRRALSARKRFNKIVPPVDVSDWNSEMILDAPPQWKNDVVVNVTCVTEPDSKTCQRLHAALLDALQEARKLKVSVPEPMTESQRLAVEEAQCWSEPALIDNVPAFPNLGEALNGNVLTNPQIRARRCSISRGVARKRLRPNARRLRH